MSSEFERDVRDARKILGPPLTYAQQRELRIQRAIDNQKRHPNYRILDEFMDYLRETNVAPDLHPRHGERLSGWTVIYRDSVNHDSRDLRVDRLGTALATEGYLLGFTRNALGVTFNEPTNQLLLKSEEQVRNTLSIAAARLIKVN